MIGFLISMERMVVMSQGIITLKGREKLCKAHAGKINLPRIVAMSFGDGGIDESGEVISPTGEEENLKNELLKKEFESIVFPLPTTSRYTARLLRADLVNKNISEQGLVDEDGDLVAYKTFLPKGKDGDMEFVFDMEEIF